MISNRCARKSLVTNCNSIISKNYLRFLVDSNVIYYKTTSEYYAISRHTTIHVILYKRILIYLPANLVSDAVYAPVTAEIPIHES